MNPMRNIRIEKVTLNIGAGEAGEKLDKGKKLLEILTKKKVLTTHCVKRTTFGGSKGRPIGVKITLRGKAATEMLKKTLEAVDNKIKASSFDKQGNVSFGIKEHIDIPGVKYDPNIGVYGMDVCITLERPGFRIKRKRMPAKISDSHMIKSEEAKEFMVKNFGVNVI